MKQLLFSLHLVFTRKDSRLIIILSTITFLLLLLLTQNGTSVVDIFSFTSLSFAKKVTLGISTLFDIKNTFTGGTLILSILGSLLGSINLSLAYTYIKMRGELILKSGLYSGIGMILAFLGIGCAACGTAFISVLLGFFGFSTMLHVLPYQGEEIGYVGLIILSFATFMLAQKVASPNVC